MKKPLQKMLLVASLGLIGFSTYAQYRTERYFYEDYNGSEFKTAGDSLKFYFTDNNNWTTALGGVDLSVYLGNYYLENTSAEYVLPKFPSTFPNNLFGATDSANLFAANSSGDGYGELSGRNICTRDANGDVTELLSREYSGGTWTNASREIYTFSSHKITEKIIQKWSDIAWVNYFKELSSYNTSGKLTEYTRMHWEGGTWVGEYKQIYDYDTAGNCTSVIYKEFAGGTSYVNSYRTLNTYNSNKKLIESVISNWSGVAWENDTKYLITYNSSGRLDVVLEQKMVGSSWKDKYRYSYFYTSGKKSVALNELYTGGIWEKVYKSTYTYTGAGKVKELTRSSWVTAESDWRNIEKLIFNYDANNNVSNFYNEFWNVGGYWEKTTSSRRFNFVYGTYASTAIQDLNNLGQVQIFPNPTAQNLNVKISWNTPQAAVMNIYDINGRILLTQDLEAAASIEKTIDVSSFSNGNYFLQINNNNGKLNQSFQVVK